MNCSKILRRYTHALDFFQAWCNFVKPYKSTRLKMGTVSCQKSRANTRPGHEAAQVKLVPRASAGHARFLYKGAVDRHWPDFDSFVFLIILYQGKSMAWPANWPAQRSLLRYIIIQLAITGIAAMHIQFVFGLKIVSLVEEIKQIGASAVART
jgi:hypothetical protein